MTHQEDEAVQTDEENQSHKLEYAMTKHNLCQLATEISKSWKKKRTSIKGKGKHRLILSEEYDDEDELHIRAAKILEDVAKSKISVEDQFKKFIENEAKKPRAKKERFVTLLRLILLI